MLQERIEDYLSLNGIELTMKQVKDIHRSVKVWLDLVVDDAISDAVDGVTYVTDIETNKHK